jgi:WS/DGAT/MGAT family acyltransferase
MASVELMAAMHDLAADAPRPAPSAHPFNPGALPSTSELVARTAINIALYPLRAGKVVVPNAVNALRHLPTLPGALASGVAAALTSGSGSVFSPATRFNGSATPHRVFEARFHDLADFKRIKACVPKATINDVTLAYVGGALRHYLDGHDELPEESLVAACPASIRSTDERGAGGNRLFGRLHPLGTSIADPLERLAAIVEETSAFRDNADSASSSRLMELVGVVPTTLLGMTVKAATAMPFSAPTIASTTVSNVPGPTEPIYFAGARLQLVTGLGPLIGGMNLFHVVASYNGTISIGATADRNALPDPAHYADCMQAAFDDLLSVADSAAVIGP